MRTLVVVEVDEAGDGSMPLDAIGEVRHIDEIVLERPPKALDEDVVDEPFDAVHADLNRSPIEDLEKLFGGKLRSLVGVEDQRLTPAKGVVERIPAEGNFQRVGQSPTEDETAVPIDDGGQIEKAVLHGNVSNIGAPDLIGRDDGDVAQQVGMDLVIGIWLAETRFGIESFLAQNSSQTLHAFAVDLHF